MTDAARVLLVDGDPPSQSHVARWLENLGYLPVVVDSGAGSLTALREHRFAFSLVASRHEDGDLIRRLRRHRDQSGPIITLTGAMSDGAGADHAVSQPLTADRLQEVITQALGTSAVTQRDGDPAARLHSALSLWRSPRMQTVRQVVEQSATADVTVLVTGETGTGKEVVARAVHQLSGRRRGPFVKVNCAAVARELLESEMFGHERGAFTGAHERKIGKFEAATHGTIFLDEIGDLHPALQGKLLHVLEDGQFSRVGGRSNIKVDVRIVAATNQDLEAAVAAERFREDLYYRLNVVRIALPPLRERAEEIGPLADHFVRHYAQVFGRHDFALPDETLEQLRRYAFPGNVRELENMVKRMIVLGSGHLPELPGERPVRTGRPGADGNGAAVRLRTISRRAALEAERVAILEALEQTRWNRVRAAKLLGISYRSLLYKIKDAALAGPRTPVP